MRKFIYIIGSMDDFESYEALKDAYFEGTLTNYNATVFEFELPMNCSDTIAMMYGRGLAFSNDWCMDGTFGDLLEA